MTNTLDTSISSPPLNSSLSAFQVGRTGCIKGYLTSNIGYRQKLLAMGLTPGTVFKVTRLAPLGDPIQLLVREYALSLRKVEVLILEIEWLPGSKSCQR